MKILVLFLALAVPASTPRLPDIPGAYAHVTRVQVCKPGYATSVRPPYSWSHAYKVRLYDDLHLSGGLKAFQLDHLVSLELGGAPKDARNLWMQPENQAGRDDKLENQWHERMCAGSLSLHQARQVELKWKRARG